MADGRMLGKLFSEQYVKKGEPVTDSLRARKRLYAHFKDLARYEQAEISKAIEKRQGIDLARAGVTDVYYKFGDYFTEASLNDVLDAITIVAIVLKQRNQSHRVAQWVIVVRNIFREEHMPYTVDDEGGVHYSPDEEFERNRISAINSIQGGRYNAVRAAFDRAFDAFDERPPNGKGAVVAVFEAVETLFRLLVNDTKCQRLGGTEVDTFLNPILAAKNREDEAAKNASLLFAKSFKQWVAACHFQRHGQPVEDPYQPPIELAVALVSAGASYLRWLAQIDSSTTNG